ncbi:hypothetical protein NDU88_008224 [Pleurodeles waltl]|uniref:Uncharacterized protein n=1 Tax=Pleurodeles waltl TaxID=8319 RepID=A0AAV7PR96_PLEWA|nr:hypothetical protein NDU88_008224 [Pleurodeles waltl]
MIRLTAKLAPKAALVFSLSLAAQVSSTPLALPQRCQALLRWRLMTAPQVPPPRISSRTVRSSAPPLRYHTRPAEVEAPPEDPDQLGDMLSTRKDPGSPF